ncbi:MAG: dihydrolipoyl dehydrogenase [Candidatus Thiodiazotropha sp. (ex Ustalcina ferruginea)]|nr:dihydrolipoyl dehydrogenase [Candidatus Thiodiazotropha sp. (ex Ustalcina ferruginea)]
MSAQFDVVVIGAGPGGYVSAVHASQLGLKVAVIEKDNPCGVCLNWGCIPSKNLIHQAEMFHAMKAMEAVGVSVDRSGLDYSKVQQNSREVVKTLTGGVAAQLKRNKVEMIQGTARITGRGEVTVDGEHKVTARNILVATGSRAMNIPGFEFDEQVVLSSSGILAMTALPKRLVILGAGTIGCEFAYVMNRFGVKVTLVEMADHLLPTEDFETCAVLEKCFKRDGIEILTGTCAKSLEKTAAGATVTVENADGEQVLNAEKVLVVFGREPNTEGLGLQEMGVKLDERGYVEIGDYYQTHSPGIYAIGDITRTPALAHVASAEGEIAVEHMAGHSPASKRVDPDLVPSAIYCEPQVAGFGLREDFARAEGIEVKKATFAYPGAGKTIAVGKPDGRVKVLCDPDTDELLGGAHIVGHNATELIHELLLVKSAELLPEDVSGMIHAHPTISETIMECMRNINGKAIHG